MKFLALAVISVGTILFFVFSAPFYSPGTSGSKKLVGCPYEGGECPNAQRLMRDYQIDVHNDTVRVYDGERLVDSYITNWKGQLDSVIIGDNQ